MTRSVASAQAAMVGVAQLVEHQVVVLGVAGSNPVAHPIETAGQWPGSGWSRATDVSPADWPERHVLINWAVFKVYTPFHWDEPA